MFDMFLDLVRSLHGPNLLRLKGIVKIAESPARPLVIHGVQHVFHPVVQLPGWPDGDERTRIVLITRDLRPGRGQAPVRRLSGRQRTRPARPRRPARQPAGALRGRRSVTAQTLATSARLPDDSPKARGESRRRRRGIAMRLIERLAADAACLRGALRTLKATTPIAKDPTRVFPAVVEDLAEKYGDAPALISERERLSYRELAERANRYARWALAQGIRKGDTVCLMMPNRPEFMAFWLGVTGVGGVVALVNTNLTGTALAHCINVVQPRHIVVAAELFEQFETARAHITGDARLWLHGEADANFPRIDREVDALPGDRLADAERRRAHHRGSRALHLHLRHHRPAQGRQHQSLPADAGEPRLCGRDGHARHRPHVRLPADVSHRRRRAGDRLAAGQRRLGGDPGEILGARVLGRRCALGLHAVPVYRRAVPLPRQLAAAPEGAGASAAPRLRQRPAPRHLAGLPAPVPDSADHRVLRRDRRQRLDVQFRRQGGRRRPHSLVHRASLPDQGRALRRHDAATGAQRAGLLHRMRRRRGGRGDRQDPQGRVEAGRPLRGLCDRDGDRQEDPARRVRQKATSGSAPAT